LSTPPSRTEAGARDIDEIVTVARIAQRTWQAHTIQARLAIVSRFRQLAFGARARLANTIATETGKPVAEALTAEVGTVLEGARFLERIANAALSPRRIRSATPALWRKRITTTYEPHGVVAVISPWNYPLLLTAMHVLPALVAGNAVILKPSELTPRTADMLLELLSNAGLPDGVLQVLHGDGNTGAALVEARIDKVFFTGSERTGRAIASSCAPRFIPVSLELGGSDAAIVLDDADLDVTTSGIVWGRFANAGQTCVAVKRVIAVDSVHDELLERLARATSALRIGDALLGDTDVGPMISARQKALVDAQLEDALAKGATIVARNEIDDTQRDRDHVYTTLVVLANVTPDMRVWQEETFGPVLATMRARDVDDAVAKANASAFGLSGSVWTRNRSRGQDVARRLETGSIAINDCVLNAGVPEVAHGGVKSSGIGRVHGIEGLMECVRTRTVVDDILPRVRQPWWFGYSARTSADVDSYLRFTHGTSLFQRISGIPGTLRLLVSRERPV
jgi:succinate-semialdehyde dehydrogenase/glutarate-semialdehyde dehydrogenase